MLWLWHFMSPPPSQRSAAASRCPSANKPQENQPGYQSQQHGGLKGPLDKLFFPGLCLYSQDLLCHGGTCDREGRFERENRLPLTGRVCPHKLHRMPLGGSVPGHLAGVNHGQGRQSLRNLVPSLWVFREVVRRDLGSLHLSQQDLARLNCPLDVEL